MMFPRLCLPQAAIALLTKPLPGIQVKNCMNPGRYLHRSETCHLPRGQPRRPKPINQTHRDTRPAWMDVDLPARAEDLLRESRTSKPTEQLPEFPSDVTEDQKKWTQYNKWVRDQSRHSYRPKINPEETSLFLFPGQGSQFVGMGDKLLGYPYVEDMYHVASGILGYDLLDVCLNGPAEKLNRTVYCQPAVLVTSLAAIERLKHENPMVLHYSTKSCGLYKRYVLVRQEKIKTEAVLCNFNSCFQLYFTRSPSCFSFVSGYRELYCNCWI